MAITPAQCRAARALIDIKREDLARWADCSFATVRRHEQDLKPPVGGHLLKRMQRVFEDRGVKFIDDRGVTIKEDEIIDEDDGPRIFMLKTPL
jgi:hypothetical protein